MISAVVRMARSVAARLRRAARSESGSATIEFVIVVPVLLTIFMSAFEVGLVMTKRVMLERAIDVSVRNLRLGLWVNPTPLMLKQSICNEAAIIPDCMNVMLLELRPVSTVTWSPLDNNVKCVQRDEVIQPLTEFVPGGANEMMLVRACAIIDPIFKTSALGLNLPVDETGGYALVATSAFVNEPD